MGLNAQNRLAVFRTAHEAFTITRSLLGPYVTLVLLTILPWSVMSALGMFDPVDDPSGPTGGQVGDGPEDYGLGAELLLWINSFLVPVVFGIFWYRYVLLGSAGALRLGLAQFNRMFWRTAGYGLAVLLVFLGALAGLLVVYSLLMALARAALGVVTGSFVGSYVFSLPLILVVYAVPLALLARLSLPFPAIALGRHLSFRESWSRMRGSTWRLVATCLVVGLPITLVADGLYFGLFYVLFDVNFLMPEFATAATDYWWLLLLLSPVLFLPLALCLAVVACAYCDLRKIPLAKPAPEASPSQ